MGEQKTLTTAPTNLKEAIDWLALVGGYGRNGLEINNYTKLSEALMNLPGFTETFKSNLNGVTSADSFVKQVTEKLGRGFLGYDGQNSETFNGSGIVKHGREYSSSYKDADWVQKDGPDYAKIFLFLAPFVYYFVSFFYWACKDKWKSKKIESTGRGSPFYYLFNAMGYTPSQLDQQKTGDTIADRLTDTFNGFSELQAAYGSGGSSSYDTFLNILEANGPSRKVNAPLTNCKIVSYEYLKSKQNGKDITAAIDAIKTELERLSARGDISNTDDFSALQEKIQISLETIKTFNPTTGSSAAGSASTWNPGSSEPGSDGPQKPGPSGPGSTSQVQPSSAGPAVGGLVGVGALGAGAAYGLNLGGLQTTINGLLHLR